MDKLELTLVQTRLKVEELKELLRQLPTDVEASKLAEYLEKYQPHVQQQINHIWEDKTSG